MRFFVVLTLALILGVVPTAWVVQDIMTFGHPSFLGFFAWVILVPIGIAIVISAENKGSS